MCLKNMFRIGNLRPKHLRLQSSLLGAQTHESEIDSFGKTPVHQM